MSSVEKKRVLVAMSGGVDSAVAAARLHDAGHEVVGCTLHLWDYAMTTPTDQRRLTAAVALPKINTTPAAPQISWASRTTRSTVASCLRARSSNHFVEAYLAGETPSPCTTCNRGVKLTELFAIADRLGCEQIATGHYARIRA